MSPVFLGCLWFLLHASPLSTGQSHTGWILGVSRRHHWCLTGALRRLRVDRAPCWAPPGALGAPVSAEKPPLRLSPAPPLHLPAQQKAQPCDLYVRILMTVYRL